MKDINLNEELPKALDIFKRNIRLAGFNDEDMRKIIKLVESSPIWIIGVENVSVSTKGGIVIVTKTNK